LSSLCARLLTDHLTIAQALLSPTTRLEDLFFALYNWLDKHQSEAVLVSVNHETGTGTPEDSAFYIKLYNILSSPLAQKYWVQTNGTVSNYFAILTMFSTNSFFKLGTLGEARGKLTLLQRFSYDLLPSNLIKRIGIPLDPDHWTDNGKIIELTYNVAKNQVAFIEVRIHLKRKRLLRLN
jgi:1-phosphatidylinositol phosphodiesterase